MLKNMRKSLHEQKYHSCGIGVRHDVMAAQHDVMATDSCGIGVRHDVRAMDSCGMM
jgi:hypothetical protein